ncbi:hypothetical protein P691DRAFT_800795 [Macrolepiota fuliginosa MF-IS2]|uniref:Nucleolar protein 9 n=1 Tax=Macrolepiota fuliginosa MF-IS2 TaxID=1400762 RepID=A0A9P6C1I1_9AGAR|nr:hypothetical protein P691DRAFT_800795 [Macrolepiota fuliginosa MF-IS2]
MPRGLRKRGRRHKKEVDDYSQEQGGAYDDDGTEANNCEHQDQISRPEPSWIVPAASRSNDDTLNPEAPFGFADAEVKAYFRTVDVQIRDWQKNQAGVEGEDGNVDVDPNEERRLFFLAALTEMQGKEKQLATDPDCSIIIERMAYSMDDFVRRVFMDSMAGSYEVLVKHRFGSHVCQTLFTLARDTVQREMKGIYPRIPESQDEGELRTMTSLILDICNEVLPTLPSLIMDPFGSHVIRSLLVLLCPNLVKEDQANSSLLRSKKSAAWKAKQGPMKSVFEKGKGKEVSNPSLAWSPEFHEVARKLTEVLRSALDENEVRAMAANKVASPGLQMMLEVEADQGLSNEPGSLMDRVTVGVITACSDGKAPPEASDYLNTLLRDTTSSHLLEAIVSRCPDNAFDVLWDLYFKGKLPRLAVHPVANFVVAKALERTNERQLLGACQELNDSWAKAIAASRTGVLRAAIDRAARLQTLSEEIITAVYSALDLETPEQRKNLVPCALTLLSFKDYNTRKATPTGAQKQDRANGKGKLAKDPLEPQIQGSLLLQSLLQLPEPHYQVVIDSIKTLPIEEQISLAHNSVSSRVYDILLSSSSITSKAKRAFVTSFIGHYHELADDRFGSRVADRCWDFSDTYLKEKIARSLVPHQQILAGSFYGKFFSRSLNLYLLQRNPEQWRNLQAEKKQTDSQNTTSLSTQPQVKAPLHQSDATVATETAPPPPKKKRKRQEDEIDVLFDAKLGKKVKKGTLVIEPGPVSSPEKNKEEKKADGITVDKDLRGVLGAIKSAPKGDKSKAKRK